MSFKVARQRVSVRECSDGRQDSEALLYLISTSSKTRAYWIARLINETICSFFNVVATESAASVGAQKYRRGRSDLGGVGGCQRYGDAFAIRSDRYRAGGAQYTHLDKI